MIPHLTFLLKPVRNTAGIAATPVTTRSQQKEKRLPPLKSGNRFCANKILTNRLIYLSQSGMATSFPVFIKGSKTSTSSDGFRLCRASSVFNRKNQLPFSMPGQHIRKQLHRFMPQPSRTVSLLICRGMASGLYEPPRKPMAPISLFRTKPSTKESRNLEKSASLLNLPEQPLSRE